MKNIILRSMILALAFTSNAKAQSLTNEQVKYRLEFVVPNKTPIQQVEYLDISGVRIKKLHPELRKYTEIQVLDLSDNKFSQIPDEVSSMVRLEKIIFKNNKFKDLSTAQKLPRSVRTINLSNNKIKTLDLAWFDHLKLDSLILSFNKIEKITNSSTRPTQSIGCIVLSNNEIESTTQDLFGSLSAVKGLDLSANELTDISPLCSYNQLELLNIYKNPIPTLSECLFESTSLKYLNIVETSITELPSSITRSKMKELHVGGNVTGAAIINNPIEEEKLNATKSLTKLVVVIPFLTKWEMNLTSIEELEIRDCFHFDSFLINSKGKNTFLNNISNDWYQPEVSNETFLPVLRSLSIVNSGMVSIPVALSEFDKLESLDLSQNNIRVLDKELFQSEGLAKLKSLDLSDNPISSIQQEMQFLNGLETLILERHELTDSAYFKNQDLILLRSMLSHTDLKLYHPALRRNMTSARLEDGSLTIIKSALRTGASGDDNNLYKCQQYFSNAEDDLFEYITLIMNLSLQPQCSAKWIALSTNYAELLDKKFPHLEGAPRHDPLKTNEIQSLKDQINQRPDDPFHEGYLDYIDYMGRKESKFKINPSRSLDIYEETCNCANSDSQSKKLKNKACKEVYSKYLALAQKLTAERRIINERIEELIGGIEDWGTANAFGAGIADYAQNVDVTQAYGFLSVFNDISRQQKELAIKELQREAETLDKYIKIYAHKAEAAYSSANFED